MKVGFLGFGKTGKEAIFPFLEDKDIRVEWVLKRKNYYRGKYASSLLLISKEKQGEIFSEEDWSESFLNDRPVDVVIDFSDCNNVEKYPLFAKYGIKIVSAVSSYQTKQLTLLKDVANQTAILWSPNITLGINLLITVAKIIASFTPEADIQIIESHFKEKRGISGTAMKIASSLQVPKEDIHSIRVGGILGKHEILFGYPYQTISLMHDTISRKAFGKGALACAKWIINKENGLFGMEDMLKEGISKTITNNK